MASSRDIAKRDTSKRMSLVEASPYDKMTEKQREVFDDFIQHRCASDTAKNLGKDLNYVYHKLNGAFTKAAILAHNEALKATVLYDESVIVNELWKMYNDHEVNETVRYRCLKDLGAHIGMGDAKLAQAKAESQRKAEGDTYNIVYYNQEKISEEVTSKKDIIEALPEDLPEDALEDNLPEGTNGDFAIVQYD